MHAAANGAVKRALVMTPHVDEGHQRCALRGAVPAEEQYPPRDRIRRAGLSTAATRARIWTRRVLLAPSGAERRAV